MAMSETMPFATGWRLASRAPFPIVDVLEMRRVNVADVINIVVTCYV